MSLGYLALVVDELGFPVFSRIYEGGQSESKTLEDVLKKLKTDAGNLLDSEKPVLIMDRGIATKDNIALIIKNEYPYTVINRRQSEKDYEKEFSTIKKFMESNQPAIPEGWDTYNLANKLKTLTNNKGSTTLSQYTYTYYLDGNQANKTDNLNNSTDYVYDGLGRMTSETVKQNGNFVTANAYTYDDYNNRQSMVVTGTGAATVTYAYDLDNRLQPEVNSLTGTTNYTYDNNGNQLAKGSQTYTYDGFNQLVGAVNGAQTMTYSYNGDGLRTGKTVNGVVINYIWDGSDVVAELNGATVAATYVRGINLIDKKGSTGTVVYNYLFNGHGDVIQLLELRKCGKRIMIMMRLAMRRTQTRMTLMCSGIVVSTLTRKQGRYILGRGIMTLRTGRFISEDSDWGKDNDPLSLNLYTYCKDDPANYYDPSGHDTATLAWLVPEAITISKWLNPYSAAVAVFTKIIGTPQVVGSDDEMNLSNINEARAENGLPPITQADLENSNSSGSSQPPTPEPPKSTFAQRIAAISAAASSVKEKIQDWGIDTYSNMKDALKNTGLQAHHIIEKRFASVLGIQNTGSMRSIALTPGQHQLFTNAWRTAIPYGTTPASMEEVYNTALKIYKDFPEIIKIVDSAMKYQGLK